MSFNKISLLIFLLLNNAYGAMPEANTQNLLVGTVAIFLLILVFRLTKKSKKRELVDILDAKEAESTEELDESLDLEMEEVIEDPYAVETQTETSTTEIQSDADTFAQSLDDAPIVESEEEAVVVDTPPARPVSRIKHPRNTNHDKIKKENFKDFEGMNILVAEDNIINQKVIKGLLAESGINVVMADDGQFALDILAQNSDFTLVLMDAHMPRVDGFEATRVIRANPEYDHIAVIALSGDIAADDIRVMQEAGMEEHLEKPLKMDHLYEILSMYMPYEDEEVEEIIAPTPSAPQKVATSVLNRSIGLEVCGGDLSLYQELISDFVDAYGESDVEIQGYIAKDDFDSIARLLLDIKGIAAQIGSNELSLCADELRNAVIAQDFNIISTLEQNYHKILHKLLKEL